MSEVTRILNAIDQGDARAASQLLPLVYDELRKLAAERMSRERLDHTLEATALVHEAYVRLVDVKMAQRWDSRGHFFAAAAEAMRRILVENARRKKRSKHGGGLRRVLLDSRISSDQGLDDLVELDAALKKLSAEDSSAGELVKLHFFAGLSLEQSGELLGLSRSSAYRLWSYARAWLQSEIEGSDLAQ